MCEDKERIRKPEQDSEPKNTEEEPAIDYAAEYKKQTGKDLFTGEYVVH